MAANLRLTGKTVAPFFNPPNLSRRCWRWTPKTLTTDTWNKLNPVSSFDRIARRLPRKSQDGHSYAPNEKN